MTASYINETKCTGRYDRERDKFATSLHNDCPDCARLSVREFGNRSVFFMSPVALWRDGVCLARQAKQKEAA